MTDLQWKMNSAVGPMFLVADPKRLRMIVWSPRDVPFARSLDESPILRATVLQLEEYFAGTRRTFDLPLDEASGTCFQRRVWTALNDIPFGRTISYRQLARAVEREHAYRAVGSANGRNPLSVVVPCHRVINADGKLGGFAGGILVKRQLLELEKRIAAVGDSR